MLLYSGPSCEFIRDATENRIARLLEEQFIAQFGWHPSPSEVNSWNNSLKSLKDVFVEASLYDHGVALEYLLPYSSRRLDCLVTGQADGGVGRAEIIELKQWSVCEPSDDPNEVVTRLGGKMKEVLHPCVQVGGYQQYLSDTHTAFYESPRVELSSCAYLHNFHLSDAEALLDAKFDAARKEYPLFLADDFKRIVSHVRDRVGKGPGLPVLSNQKWKGRT